MTTGMMLPYSRRHVSRVASKLVSTLLLFSSFRSFGAYASIKSSTRKVTLITFDVDGTLIHGSSTSAEISSHAKAFSYGVGSVFAESNVDEFMNKYPYPLTAIDSKNYHGSTDGLIALHFAKEACGVHPTHSFTKLDDVFRKMFEYVIPIPDDVMCRGIEPLPGVIDTLHKLRNHDLFDSHVLCGLVTGNVEGIARKKMRACGILATQVLSKKAAVQQEWPSEEHCAFLGGFGSDFCSGDIHDSSRVFKDRGEQIVIAYQRAKSLLAEDQEIVRVVHCGDAPGDVLAAKYCSEEGKFGDGVVTSCIAVATGKFTAEALKDLCGEAVPGRWEPVVLEKGLADPNFVDLCKISQ